MLRPYLTDTDHLVLGSTGLWYVYFMPEMWANLGLLTALGERYHSETGMFHLPTGEIMVTLEDAHRILQIPIQGELIEYESATGDGLAECR